MIIVDRLTKIYKTKRLSVTALREVSFTLPDCGMVFIIGKSGSGKSTLLNLLGGLDEATSGDISVDGLKFSEMRKESGFDSFRNLYLGFIFQDFHLIGRLNIAQNIELSLNLEGNTADADERKNKVRAALEQVGLEGYENRYPKELSGGQQQRVAIARAIVKDPKLILADEPTGNLDTVTSRQILDLLKELSGDRLVVVVSHSMEAANGYADRIIELGEGRVVGDVTRAETEHEKIVDKDVITLPDGRLTDDELRQVNEAVKSGNVVVKRCREKFEQTKQIPQTEVQTPIKQDKNPKLPFKNKTHLGFRLMNASSLIVSVLLTAVTAVIFVICLQMYFFDGDAFFKNGALNTTGIVIMQKDLTAQNAIGSIALNKIYRVEDDDEKAFYDVGYGGKIYKLYNMAVGNGAEEYNGMLKGEIKRQDKLYGSFFADETLGVIVADEDYLKRRFGDFEVLAGSLDATPYGIILTDYFADSILTAQPDRAVAGDKYVGLLGKEQGRGSTYRFYVNAVIKTDYKEKHAKLIKMYDNAKSDGLLSEDEKTAISSTEEYSAFLTDAQTRLNIAYSINSDFIEASRQRPYAARNSAFIFNADIYDDSGNALMQNIYGSLSAGSTHKEMPPLAAGEAFVSRSFYNELFGTHLTGDDDPAFEEKTITICDYAPTDLLKAVPLTKTTLRIKGLWGEYGYTYISDDDFDVLREKDVFAYSLVFDSTDGIDSVLDAAAGLGYVPNAGVYSDMLLVTRVMQVYSDLFLGLALVLLAVGLMMLIAFAVRSVRSRIYEIGILRSLGASLGSVAGIFLVQMLFAGSLVCLLSIIGQLALNTVANKLVTSGLAAFMHNGSFKNLTLISFDPTIMAISLAAIVLITLLSAIIPLIKLTKIKPIEILRKKD